MCWLEGTCMVLEEGGGAVPAEIAVALNLMYISDEEYLRNRQAEFQNMPFPLLDSLNMTFTPASVARRNSLNKTEGHGSEVICSQGFPSLKD
eukprot:Nk52_evm21s2309 gene=Nk52_evmTU21s2309